ncbi:extensin-like [Varroa destructor]|uniref:FAS1 domain-containing protein n=1 Tax=Varroa destructor TaxID=109461 RepID=A0A7M7KSM0_VARDE|nr:extensin-like [Varroa destructor]
MAVRGLFFWCISPVLFVLCSVCLSSLVVEAKDALKTQGGSWKPIVTDPKTGKDVAIKVTEKEVLTKTPPKGIDPKKISTDVKTDRSGRVLAEQGNSASNAFYVWLPTDILNMDNRPQQLHRSQGASNFRRPQGGPSFNHHNPSNFGPQQGNHGSFGLQGHSRRPLPGPSPQQFVPPSSNRHNPNYLPDQGADVQPGGVRIYSGFRPIPNPQSYNRPQPAYQPPPGAAPNPVQHHQSLQQGPQIYIPQQEIPRPNPQSYHGPRAENGHQYHHPPVPQQYHSPPLQQYHAPPQPAVNQPPVKAPGSSGYGASDLDDDDLPEPGYGAAPRPQQPPAPAPSQPSYGNSHRPPTPEYNQQPQPQFGLAAPPPPPPQSERGYGTPARRPSSYGQPPSAPQFHSPVPAPQPQLRPSSQPQFKAHDATPRPVGIVSARPQSPPYNHAQSPIQPQPPQQVPPHYKPVNAAPVQRPPAGNGGYGRPEPFEEDDYPVTRPVTIAPSTEYYPGTVSPGGHQATAAEEAGVGVIEPRSAATCAATSRPTVRSTSSLREIASELRADLIFNEFGVSDTDILSAANQDGQYTIFLPANEARLFTNPELLAYWRQDRDSLMRTLTNHLVAGQISLDQLRKGGSYVSRTGQNAVLNARGHDDGTVTVNGQRVIYADITVPNGGLLHIVGGFLHPIADKDIIPLVQDCGKYDGFVTLAAGTGFNQELQGSPGGYTLFLPSNDALSKVPKDELDVIRTNTTALREFLRYHAAEGIHFSHNLRDGQYLTSLHNKTPLRVSVNTDGCRRRLYEVNNSPLYRADIPASNGVVHVIDWVLLPSDHRWCSNVILP